MSLLFQKIFWIYIITPDYPYALSILKNCKVLELDLKDGYANLSTTTVLYKMSKLLREGIPR